ncbi:uncharacterized protein LOC142612420 [Castanea sativa]|uniref:uncharacterized protein LOC142612420 n=1 Tax=Castanea sativa TaxID=21020 RepID=UPI003F64E0E9
MTRTPTEETPFNLTYGTRAIIPVEVGITSIRRDFFKAIIRREFFNKETNNDQLRMNLDCLDEIRDDASRIMARYQQKMSGYYNQRVKLRRFNIGDLVQRKVTPATKDPTHGKLRLTWEGPCKVTHYSRQESYHLESLDGSKLPYPWNVERLKRYH